jgi:hypothetical protein
LRSINQLGAIMGKLVRLLVVLLALMGAGTGTYAQDAEGGGGKSAGISKKQYDKQAAKKARKDKKAVKREEKHLLREHRRHQDKATRKRMRRNKRGADNSGPAGQHPGFFQRLFTKH